jgi:hypothetical protein
MHLTPGGRSDLGPRDRLEGRVIRDRIARWPSGMQDAGVGVEAGQQPLDSRCELAHAIDDPSRGRNVGDRTQSGRPELTR